MSCKSLGGERKSGFDTRGWKGYRRAHKRSMFVLGFVDVFEPVQDDVPLHLLRERRTGRDGALVERITRERWESRPAALRRARDLTSVGLIVSVVLK